MSRLISMIFMPSMVRYLGGALICLFLFLPGRADALWPFGASAKEPYIAKIDDYAITEDYFARSIRSLHSSNKTGEILSRESSFAIVDFSKHLSDIIDKKLMIFEVKRLGFDKDNEYAAQMKSFKLNLFLARLRKEEILDKVRVSEKELKQYLKAIEKEKKAIEREQEQQNNVVEAPLDEVSKEDSLEEVLDDKADESKTDAHSVKELTAKDRIYAKKVVERETEYFKSLRAKARVKIYDDALKVIVESGENLPVNVIDATIVAKVSGEALKAYEFMIHVKRGGHGFSDEAILRDELDMLILHKLLDKAALAKKYEKKLPLFVQNIEAYSEKRLVNLFERKVIAPIVKVSDEDVLKYYNKNKDKFLRSDGFNISTITVVGEDSAQELLKDLKSGADFAYIAKNMSIDPSKSMGGKVGWVLKDDFPAVVTKELSGAKKGDLLGPFEGQYGYFVVLLNDFEVGELASLSEVEGMIKNRLGRDAFKATLKEYLLRLRDTVEITVNKDVLRRFNEGKR